MHISELIKIAKQMVVAGKGILAADESEKTVGKRFASINLENNEDNRRAFREMLLTAPGEGAYISGVILHDETIRQSLADGRSFVSILQKAGILPGIKVDLGLEDFGDKGEKVTKGLDGLSDRLKEYVSLGAKFCKWRAVITIGDPSASGPTDENIRQNAKDLASYAITCQENGLVPMVEPEVLLEGSHSIDQAREASRKILTALFEELKNAGVALEGAILKTSMVLSGKNSGVKASPEEVAKATVDLFKEVLPKELAGEAFLSGGQSELEATANLNAMHHSPPKADRVHGAVMNQMGELSWPLTFSYARALQDSATRAWQGKKENMEIAQKVFLHRAKMNSLASQGKYASDMEKGFDLSKGGEATQD
ncbi:MAG: class I fructose-bisphosphate aldolase [Patescibacteria group bacterium]